MTQGSSDSAVSVYRNFSSDSNDLRHVISGSEFSTLAQGS
nr:MAG TPA: hypothetical protein [Caudoviricetes sp.]